MATQSIIVYRNPGEEALWSMIMSPGGFVFMATATFAIVAFAVFHNLSERFVPRVRGYDVQTLVATVVTAICTLGFYQWLQA